MSAPRLKPLRQRVTRAQARRWMRRGEDDKYKKYVRGHCPRLLRWTDYVRITITRVDDPWGMGVPLFVAPSPEPRKVLAYENMEEVAADFATDSVAYAMAVAAFRPVPYTNDGIGIVANALKDVLLQR